MLCCYKVAQIHRVPHLYRSLSAKEPYNQWLFRGGELATEGILCVFAALESPLGQHVTVCCSVLQCAAMRCSVLQCDVVTWWCSHALINLFFYAIYSSMQLEARGVWAIIESIECQRFSLIINAVDKHSRTRARDISLSCFGPSWLWRHSTMACDHAL